MVSKGGRKPRGVKNTIIQHYRAGKSTSEIIATLGYTAQKDKDYVYHVITEARNLGIKPVAKVNPSNNGRGTTAQPVQPPAQNDTSGLVIEEAPVVEEAQDVSSMYQEKSNNGATQTAGENPISPATESEPSPDLPAEPPVEEDEGTEIDLSDLVELPIDIEDKIFRRRGMEPLTEEEKSNIRNHGNVMIAKRIKIKSKYGDVINYVKAFMKPLMVRVIGKKFTKDIEQQEQESSDAMEEYNRQVAKKGQGGEQ